MNLNEIKVGNFYHVLVKVLHIDPINGEIATETANEFGTSLNMEPTYFARCEKEAFFPINLENGTKNAEAAPKHDPCRRFRKGDKVRYVKRNGRFCPSSNAFVRQLSILGTVVKNEHPHCFVYVKFENEEGTFPIDPAYLELVTPVEELEPYYVEEEWHSWCVRKQEPSDLYSTPAWFSKKRHPNAKAAAEAECKRLNDEHRKEPK